MAQFLDKNIAAAAAAIENAMASERWSRSKGLLQSVDPRLKVAGLAAALLLCSLTGSIPVLLLIHGSAIGFALLSGFAISSFLKRVWIFVPAFTGLIAIPALFLTPGREIAAFGPLHVTREGIITAELLVLRVSACVSFTTLFMLSTPWNRVLEAFRWFRLPQIIVSLLAVTYRYLLLLLRTLSELMVARRSRILRRVSFRQNLSFLSRSAGYLFLRSLHIAEGVQMAMTSRGHSPELERTGNGVHTPDGDAALEDQRRGMSAQRHPALPAGEEIFRLENVRYTYPDGIAGVEIDSVSVPAGLCTILLGPNGSGKSTLLKLLDGLIFPRSGKVFAFGTEVSEKRLADPEFRRLFRSRVGLVFQDADMQCFSPTVRDELAFGPVQRGLEREAVDRAVEKIIDLLDLGAIADRYPYRLSDGEKKRVAIASVLTVDPNVYLMDEPTANLDPATEGRLIDLLADLKERGKSLVVATQDLLLAGHIGDWAIVLGSDKRPIGAGPINDVLGDPKRLELAGLLHTHRSSHGSFAAPMGHTHGSEGPG